MFFSRLFDDISTNAKLSARFQALTLLRFLCDDAEKRKILVRKNGDYQKICGVESK